MLLPADTRGDVNTFIHSCVLSYSWRKIIGFRWRRNERCSFNWQIRFCLRSLTSSDIVSAAELSSSSVSVLSFPAQLQHLYTGKLGNFSILIDIFPCFEFFSRDYWCRPRYSTPPFQIRHTLSRKTTTATIKLQHDNYHENDDDYNYNNYNNTDWGFFIDDMCVVFILNFVFTVIVGLYVDIYIFALSSAAVHDL